MDLLLESEAAEELRLSVRTLQRWRVEGGGPPFVRLGRHRIAYRRQDIERWAMARIVANTSEPGVAEPESTAADEACDTDAPHTTDRATAPAEAEPELDPASAA